jgi:hypothetical protein
MYSTRVLEYSSTPYRLCRWAIGNWGPARISLEKKEKNRGEEMASPRNTLLDIAIWYLVAYLYLSIVLLYCTTSRRELLEYDFIEYVVTTSQLVIFTTVLYCTVYNILLLQESCVLQGKYRSSYVGWPMAQWRDESKARDQRRWTMIERAIESTQLSTFVPRKKARKRVLLKSSSPSRTETQKHLRHQSLNSLFCGLSAIWRPNRRTE